MKKARFDQTQPETERMTTNGDQIGSRHRVKREYIETARPRPHKPGASDGTVPSLAPGL
jgi:hypothetical protein